MSDSAFTNHLGMPFVAVPGVQGLFCVWPTRRRDYETYAKAVRRVDRTWMNVEYNGRPVGHEPDHPVVGVSRLDAERFLHWLTRYERLEGFIGTDQEYRLPFDWDWSAAAGLREERRDYPFLQCSGVEDVYPFSGGWSPDPKAGNYCDAALWPEYREDLLEWNREIERRKRDGEDESSEVEDVDAGVAAGEFLTDHRCGFETTSPVGSFRPNDFGLYDLGGNVWEWTANPYGPGPMKRYYILRGASWATCRRQRLLSSYRLPVMPDTRYDRYGFRCLLVTVEADEY